VFGVAAFWVADFGLELPTSLLTAAVSGWPIGCRDAGFDLTGFETESASTRDLLPVRAPLFEFSPLTLPPTAFVTRVDCEAF
jgi:hypothetical protein